MSEINTGGGAFPWCGDLNKTPYINLGLTVRDLFAAAVVSTFVDTGEYKRLGMTVGQVQSANDTAARRAYELADAMIRARGEA